LNKLVCGNKSRRFVTSSNSLFTSQNGAPPPGVPPAPEEYLEFPQAVNRGGIRVSAVSKAAFILFLKKISPHYF
jgi:hypothetical protein